MPIYLPLSIQHMYILSSHNFISNCNLITYTLNRVSNANTDKKSLMDEPKANCDKYCKDLQYFK